MATIQNIAKPVESTPPRYLSKLVDNCKKHWRVYLMALPGVVFFILFKYMPLGGMVMAFQDFSIFRGIEGSDWVGFANFERLFSYKDFYRVFYNTMRIGIKVMVVEFPIPLLLAILINEVKNVHVKRGVQSLLYVPHFLSWVIIGGLAFQLFSLNGAFNGFRAMMGLEKVLPIQEARFFDTFVIGAGIWKDAGWGTIIYLAAITGIGPQLYEAAIVDGATKIQRIWHITLPSLIPTAIILFLMRMGRFLDVGFDRVYQFITPMTYSVGDIFSTFSFRMGVLGAQYSLTAAMGLFESLVGLILIVSFNKLANRISESGGLW